MYSFNDLYLSSEFLFDVSAHLDNVFDLLDVLSNRSFDASFSHYVELCLVALEDFDFALHELIDVLILHSEYEVLCTEVD